jgi:hypothetical protein
MSIAIERHVLVLIDNAPELEDRRPALFFYFVHIRKEGFQCLPSVVEVKLRGSDKLAVLVGRHTSFNLQNNKRFIERMKRERKQLHTAKEIKA